MSEPERTRTRLARLTPAAALQERLADTAVDELTQLLTARPTREELAWSGLAFRRRLLEACGVGPEGALALALRPEIGLQELLDLLRRGCAPDTAVEILL